MMTPELRDILQSGPPGVNIRWVAVVVVVSKPFTGGGGMSKPFTGGGGGGGGGCGTNHNHFKFPPPPPFVL